jgi:glycine cleavage system H protein
MYPQEFLYSKEHTWVRIDEFLGTIGITEHAQKELGDIMYVALPKVGDRVMARESLETHPESLPGNCALQFWLAERQN